MVWFKLVETVSELEKEFVLRIDYLLLGGEMRVTLIIWPVGVIECKVFELLWTLQHRVEILKFSYMIFNYYEVISIEQVNQYIL